MKRISFILALTGIYLILCSKSCNDQYEQSREDAELAIQVAKDSLLSAAPRISSPNLSILSEEARFLFTDIADYLKIVADSSLPDAFRHQARGMILEGFLSENTTIRVSTEKGNNRLQDDQPGGSKTAVGRVHDPAKITVLEFPLIRLLDKADSGFMELLIARPDTIWVAAPLKQLSDTLFQGTLGYLIRHQGESIISGKQYIFPGKGFMDFYAVTEVKVFGYDTLKVWTVRLGENRIK